MSVAVSRSDGVTVLTLTSDPSSVCPPLCQLLRALCYSPRLCGASRRLTPQRGGPQAALGALWIITGLLHIGLGAILLAKRARELYVLRDTYCPLWLGGVFMFFGVCCVLTERHPRIVLLNSLLNLAGAALSIAAIVWYSSAINIYRLFISYHFHQRSEMSEPGVLTIVKRSMEATFLQQSLIISIFTLLVTLSILDLCVGLSSAVFSFMALKRGTSQSGTTALLDDAKATTQDKSSGTKSLGEIQ